MDAPSAVGQRRYVVEFERITRTGDRQRYIGGAYATRAQANMREDVLAGRDDCTGATCVTEEIATADDSGSLAWVSVAESHAEVCS